MRNVKYGMFVDFMPPTMSGCDCDLIGAHIYIRNAQRAALRTAKYYYYVLRNGSRITIYDATFLEKALARTKFVFTPNKGKILGTKTSKEAYNPYRGPVQQLGVCYDKKGELVADSSYFDSGRERALASGDTEAYERVNQREKEVTESLQEERAKALKK